jgi:hypothetical protein
MIASDGEFVLFPGIYPPISGAEKVALNMVPWKIRLKTKQRALSNESAGSSLPNCRYNLTPEAGEL